MVKKTRSPQKVLKNLLLLREELARWKVSYVDKTIVEKIDKCLYGDYKLIRNEENERGNSEVE